MQTEVFLPLQAKVSVSFGSYCLNIVRKATRIRSESIEHVLALSVALTNPKECAEKFKYFTCHFGRVLLFSVRNFCCVAKSFRRLILERCLAVPRA